MGLGRIFMHFYGLITRTDSFGIVLTWKHPPKYAYEFNGRILLISELFSNGTNLHLCIQKYLEGQTDIDLKEPNQGHWASLEPVLGDITDVACTEKSVKHPVLRYKGILDCVANYRLVHAFIVACCLVTFLTY